MSAEINTPEQAERLILEAFKSENEGVLEALVGIVRSSIGLGASPREAVKKAADSFAQTLRSRQERNSLDLILEQIIALGQEELNLEKRDLYEQIIGKLQVLINLDKSV